MVVLKNTKHIKLSVQDIYIRGNLVNQVGFLIQWVHLLKHFFDHRFTWSRHFLSQNTNISILIHKTVLFFGGLNLERYLMINHTTPGRVMCSLQREIPVSL